MSTDQKGSGGTTQSSGGATEQNQKKDDVGSEDKRPSYESYQKLLDEKKAAAKRVADLESQLTSIDSEKKAAEEKKLKDKEDFKKLLELREKENEELKQKLSVTETTLQSKE